MTGSGRVEAPALVLPTRVCVERQADNVRRLRPGTPGLTTTNDAVSALGRALSPSGRLGAFATESCRYLLDGSESDADRHVATEDLLARMKVANAESAIVTEIAVRLVCAPRRGGMPGSPCHEDDVQVSVLLFDRRGTIVRTASARVVDGDDAVRVARAVVPSPVTSSPVAPLPASACQLRSEWLLDCT